jgi:ABC-type branched-subunit amino acid transport system ATPase component
MSLLEVAGLNTCYGDSHILFDIALRIEANEVVALLGRDGAGKSTTLKSLMGIVAAQAAGQDALARAVFKAAVHHSRSSISVPAGATSSASPASTSPPWK